MSGASRAGLPPRILIWTLALGLGAGCGEANAPEAESSGADAAAPAPEDAEVSGDRDGTPGTGDRGVQPMDAAPDAREVTPIEDAAPPPAAAIRINEIQCRGDEWIELYFGGPGPADLTGWALTDDNDDPERRLALPAVQIQPGTVWLSPDELPFNIGCEGDEIRLRSPAGVLVDTVSVGDPQRGLTWGRLPDGEGVWGLTEPTPGALNAPPAPPEARINEIDCSGRARIELVTGGDEDVELAGWVVDAQAGEEEGPGERHRLSGRINTDEFHLVRQQTRTEDGFTFDVSCAGQTLTLYRPDGSVADTVHLDSVPAAYTWGRLPDRDGEWQRTAPTLGDPNAPPGPDVAVPFDPTTVLEIDLELAEGSRDALVAEPREYAPARLTVRGHTAAPLAVGLRIKGRAGSFRRIDQKPGWKIKLDFLVPDQLFLGRERMTLNNMVQDPSQIHEWAAYGLFRSLGLPAPRVGYAFVRLDGEIYGLYTVIESPDDEMLGRWFATTQHLYEGGYGQDLFPQHVDQLEADRGDLVERSDLQAVVDRLEGLPSTPKDGDKSHSNQIGRAHV